MFNSKRLLVPLSFLVASNSFADQISFENSTLSEFAHFVGSIVQRPIVITSELNKPFSLHTDFSNPDHLLMIFKDSIIASGYSYSDSGASIVVSDLDITSGRSLETRIFPLKYQNSGYVLAHLKQHVTKLNSFQDDKAGVHVDERSNNPVSQVLFSESPVKNVLIVTASPDQFRHIIPMVSALDLPSRQVLIEAVITELSKDDFEGLDSKLTLAAGLDSVSSDLMLVNPAAGFSLKLLNSKSIRFFLDYINTTDNSNILSQPKLAVIDRETASFTVGQNVPFVTGRVSNQAASVTTPFQTIERQDIGLNPVMSV
ncbi:partial Secretin XcpQ, partial [Candidatus Brocadiaceae bacterium]